MTKQFVMILPCLWLLITLESIVFTQERSGEKNPPMRGEQQVLTEAQQTAAKGVLKKYNPSTLSSQDAKAIHQAMRELGIQGGPAEHELLRSAGFDPELLKKLDPPPDRRNDGRRDADTSGTRREPPQNDDRGRGQKSYNLEQAISDNAQLHTIAFSGLAFLTGDFGAATFIPPGKVCDFFGFQYMRDIDAAEKGHNPMFLNRVAGNVLSVLNADQKKVFMDLAEEQAPQLEDLAKMRLPLIMAFFQQRDGRLPAGSSGLDKEAVKRSVGEIFELDARLSLRRAEAMARVALSLTPEQKAYLGKMKFGDFNTWPAVDERDKLRRPAPGESKMVTVAYMTYASEFFSWTAGSVDADVYFCPERHGTYFGGFYMKDMPAMGKRDYDISTSKTGESGKDFLNDVLTSEQRKSIEVLPNLQRRSLADIVTVRRAISLELRKYLNGRTPDVTEVVALGRRYGELDGELSWYYAMAFARVHKTLTPSQNADLAKLRNLDGYKSAPYYIYSQAVQSKPELGNVDVFFFSPEQGQ